jgi:tRNA threonylcarbamoyladenosine biosynthesis protein TsaB
MALILSIDTSTKVCSIALHQDGQELAHQVYHLQKSHSSLLPMIVKQIMENVDKKLTDLQAVAVAAGPGSYTGLRIGTSTAKGLCFGLNIPLLSFDSLDSMYESVKTSVSKRALICPMIDARRMEVYCNLRGEQGQLIWPSQPLILDESTFDEFADRSVVLVGNGAEKCRSLYPKREGISYLPEVYPNAFAVAGLVEDKFQRGLFEDLTYFEPEYLKEYRTKPPKDKLNV